MKLVAAAQENARRNRERDHWCCTSAMKPASPAKVLAAQIAGSLLMRGTAKHTRQQLQDELDN